MKISKFLIINTKRSNSNTPTNKRYLINLDASLDEFFNIIIDDNEIGPNHRTNYEDFDYKLQNMDGIYLDAGSNSISNATISNNFLWLIMGDGSGITIYARTPNEVTQFNLDSNYISHNGRNGVEIQGNFNNSNIYDNSIFYQLYTRAGYQTMYGNGLV